MKKLVKKPIFYIAIALIIAVLNLFIIPKLGEMPLKVRVRGNVLKNSYFSIDISGYEDTLIGVKKTGRTSDLAHAYRDLDGEGQQQYIVVQGVKVDSFSVPNKEYFLTDLKTAVNGNVVKAELTRYESIPGVPANRGAIVSCVYEMADGSIRYYTDIIFSSEDGKLSFSIHFYDYDGDTEEDDIYKAAIDSFKVK